jgi:NAD(P)-dependent dehydrogenase (short-subunit alcohol dehydrogenase family)
MASSMTKPTVTGGLAKPVVTGGLAKPVVVVTGSTRGIGLGLAEAFLDRGCRVVVSGRSPEAVAKAVGELSARHAGAEVTGHACDVGDLGQVESLWSAATAAFGGVDLWVNNAGICTAQLPFVDLPPEEIASVVRTNLMGAMHGSHVALRGMQRQGRGQIFHMEGWGSRGEWLPGMTLYSSTKLALRYFSDALAREVKGSAIRVGTLSPGMVLTDSLVSAYQNGAPENWKRMRWLFHFVIDPPGPVCAWLAEKALGNRANAAHLTWMSPWRLAIRFFQPRYYRRNPVAGSPLDTLGR